MLLLSLPHFLLGVEGHDHGRSMRIPLECFYFFLPLFLVSPQLLVLFDCFLNKLSWKDLYASNSTCLLSAIVIFHLCVLAPISARHVFLTLIAIVPSMSCRSLPLRSNRPEVSFFLFFVNLLHLVMELLLKRVFDLSLLNFFVKTSFLMLRNSFFLFKLLLSFALHFLNYKT